MLLFIYPLASTKRSEQLFAEKDHEQRERQSAADREHSDARARAESGEHDREDAP